MMYFLKNNCTVTNSIPTLNLRGIFKVGIPRLMDLGTSKLLKVCLHVIADDKFAIITVSKMQMYSYLEQMSYSIQLDFILLI